jgi:imidazolonepropionase-like amidohydrolase
MTQKLYLPIPAAGKEKIRMDFEKFQRPLTKAFFDRGGKMMAGSDTILPGLVPGFALHGELREMVDVGMTPYQALRTSTTTPFEYLGEAARAGTIEVGKFSDLVLLDADPLKDITGISKIAGVLMRGRWIGSDEIRKRMEEIKAPL